MLYIHHLLYSRFKAVVRGMKFSKSTNSEITVIVLFPMPSRPSISELCYVSLRIEQGNATTTCAMYVGFGRNSTKKISSKECTGYVIHAARFIMLAAWSEYTCSRSRAISGPLLSLPFLQVFVSSNTIPIVPYPLQPFQTICSSHDGKQLPIHCYKLIHIKETQHFGQLLLWQWFQYILLVQYCPIISPK